MPGDNEKRIEDMSWQEARKAGRVKAWNQLKKGRQKGDNRRYDATTDVVKQAIKGDLLNTRHVPATAKLDCLIIHASPPVPEGYFIRLDVARENGKLSSEFDLEEKKNIIEAEDFEQALAKGTLVRVSLFVSGDEVTPIDEVITSICLRYA